MFLCRAGAGGGPRAPGPPARALCLGGVNKVPFNKSASAWLLTHPPCPGRWDGAGVGRGGVRCRGSRGTLLEHLLCSRLWGRRREHSQARPSPLRGPHAPSLSGPRPSDAPAEAAHRTWRPPARQTDPQTATAACFRSPGSRDALALPPCPGLRAPRAPRALASAPPWWLLLVGGQHPLGHSPQAVSPETSRSPAPDRAVLRSLACHMAQLVLDLWPESKLRSSSSGCHLPGHKATPQKPRVLCWPAEATHPSPTAGPARALPSSGTPSSGRPSASQSPH